MYRTEPWVCGRRAAQFAIDAPSDQSGTDLASSINLPHRHGVIVVCFSPVGLLFSLIRVVFARETFIILAS